MPVVRPDILESFISAIEGLIPQAQRPVRAPMRTPAPAGGSGPDLEAARRLAGPARASQVGEAAVRGALSPGATRASTTGAEAIRSEFEALIRQSQANPEVRFRGELRPDIQSPPPAPQPPTGLQNAPLATQQLQSVIQRTGRQAQRQPLVSQDWLNRARQTLDQNRGAAPRLPTPATSPQTAEAGARAFLQDRLGYVPAGDPESWARRYGLTSPETYRAGTAQRHPTEYRAPSPPRLPTPAQTTTRQALTPSRATQPQTGRTPAPPIRNDWTEPAQRQFFDQHLRAPLGMTPQQFDQHYFAGYVTNPTVRSTYGALNIRGSVRAPQDMVARNARGQETRVRAGTYLGTIERDIRPRDREVYNAYFALDPQYQGMGVARQVFRNQIDVYRRMGNIDRVVVNAGLDGGGHTWARFGFVPDQDGWNTLRGRLQRVLPMLTNADPAGRALAEMLLANNDPISIRELAAIPNIGRRLLAGTGWHGTLDMRNPRDMNYFDAYVDPNRSRQ